MADRASSTADGIASDRGRALALLDEWVQSEALRRHALAVEAAMRAYARDLGADEDGWGCVALLHDFDWERHPSLDRHPQDGEPVLASLGYPDWFRRAILSHAEHTGVPRATPLEHHLYACDELAGFITAISYVKPNRSVFEVDAASVKKKMKDKAFARSVNRQDIVEGAQELGVPLEEHVEFCIKAMQERAGELGLAGNAASAG